MSVKTKERKLKITSDYIEAGELANEIGKFYIADLDSAIEDGKEINVSKLYFIVQTEKDPTDLTKIEIRIGITNNNLKYLKESTDFWEYDYNKNEKKLLWSVPHRIDMKNFLRAKNKYSKEMIYWIEEYLKQNPEINLKDKASIILS